MFSRGRQRKYVTARNVMRFLARELTSVSFKQLGERYGLKADHTTVIHSCQTVRNLIDTEECFRLEVEKIRSKITGVGVEVIESQPKHRVIPAKPFVREQTMSEAEKVAARYF